MKFLTTCTHAVFYVCLLLGPLLLLLPSSLAFPVVVSPPKTTTSQTSSSSTCLFHNQKKKRSSKGSAGAGFASAFRNSPYDDDVFPYTGTVRPGQQSPQRVVLQEDIVKPDYWQTGRPLSAASRQLRLPWMIEVKTATEIARMREAGRLARHVLDLAGRMVEPGITTDEIDAAVHQEILQVGKKQYTKPTKNDEQSCCCWDWYLALTRASLYTIMYIICTLQYTFVQQTLPEWSLSFSPQLSRLSQIVLHIGQ